MALRTRVTVDPGCLRLPVCPDPCGRTLACLRMLCVVDGEPSFWPHTNEHASDPVPRVFGVPVAYFGAEIAVREGAQIALKVCRFDRDDRPLHADVLIKRQ